MADNYEEQTKKAYNKNFMHKVDDLSESKGAAGVGRYEPIPGFVSTESEKLISNRNAFIVLGKDRPSSEISGYGGMGEISSDMIDIVVGRKTNLKQEQEDYDKKADPDFFDDAARIYLTQKGDIDTYFGIAEGTENNLVTEKKSGIGIKADHVRLFGREHIKIVTGQSENFGAKSDKNSLGETIGKVGRIDFIAGNYNDSVSDPSKLQPLVKGDNLVELQKEIIETLQDLTIEITKNTADIMTLFTMLGTVVAPATALAAAPPALGSFQSAMMAKVSGIVSNSISQQIAIQKGLVATQINYLEIVDGSQYINSEHVFTT
jgi:hypothetical protein